MNFQNNSKQIVINLPQQQIVIDQNGVLCKQHENLTKESTQQQQHSQRTANQSTKNTTNTTQASSTQQTRQLNPNMVQSNTINTQNRQQPGLSSTASYQNFVKQYLQQRNANQRSQELMGNPNSTQSQQDRIMYEPQQIEKQHQFYPEYNSPNQQNVSSKSEQVSFLQNKEGELQKSSCNPAFSRSSKVQRDQTNDVQQKSQETRVDSSVQLKNHIFSSGIKDANSSQLSNTKNSNKNSSQKESHSQTNENQKQQQHKTSKNEILQLARGIVKKALIQSSENKEEQQSHTINNYSNTRQTPKHAEKSEINKQQVTNNIQQYQQQSQQNNGFNQNQLQQINFNTYIDRSKKNKNNINHEESKHNEFGQCDNRNMSQNYMNKLDQCQPIKRRRENNSNIYMDNYQFDKINSMNGGDSNIMNKKGLNNHDQQLTHNQFYNQNIQHCDEQEIDSDEEEEQEGNQYPSYNYSQESQQQQQQQQYNNFYEKEIFNHQNNIKIGQQQHNQGRRNIQNIHMDQEEESNYDNMTEEEHQQEQEIDIEGDEDEEEDNRYQSDLAENNNDNEYDDEEDQLEEEEEEEEEDQDIEEEEQEIEEDEYSYEENDENESYYQLEQGDEINYDIHMPEMPPLPDDLEFAYDMQEQQIYEEYEPNDESFSQNTGLTKAEIMSLPTIVYTTQSLRMKAIKQYSSQQDCSICLNHYTDKEILRVLPCEHRFHRACIDKWLMQNSKCVICKLDLLSNHNNQEQ